MTIVTLQRLWSVGVPLAGALIAWWWLPGPAEPWLVVVGAALAPVAVVAGLLAIEFTVAAAVDPRSPRSPPLRPWVHRIGTTLWHPWVYGYQRHPTSPNIFWKFIDIDPLPQAQARK